jgi:hypothetical protein
MTAQEIIERIMTHHWDLMACRCWICDAGRELGFKPRLDYLWHHGGVVVARVPMIDWQPNPFRNSEKNEEEKDGNDDISKVKEAR